MLCKDGDLSPQRVFDLTPFRWSFLLKDGEGKGVYFLRGASAPQLVLTMLSSPTNLQGMGTAYLNCLT
jgi:hypothetical protein